MKRKYYNDNVTKVLQGKMLELAKELGISKTNDLLSIVDRGDHVKVSTKNNKITYALYYYKTRNVELNPNILVGKDAIVFCIEGLIGCLDVLNVNADIIEWYISKGESQAYTMKVKGKNYLYL